MMPAIAAAPAAHRRYLATEREMEALVYLAASSGLVAADAIGLDLAYEGEGSSVECCRARGHRILRSLAAHGLLEREHFGYRLTERGRIAVALIRFRRPGMMAAFFDEDEDR